MLSLLYFVFFFKHTATTEIYTLSLHDALPICPTRTARRRSAPTATAWRRTWRRWRPRTTGSASERPLRSEEHTSELQSLRHLVCRLLLEKKKKHTIRKRKPHEIEQTHITVKFT